MKDRQGRQLHGITRRELVKLGLLTVTACLLSFDVSAQVEDAAARERWLSLFSPHTEERFEGIYWSNGHYITSAIDRINYIFRDHYNGAVTQIDRNLIELLSLLQARLSGEDPLHIISGYRTKKTNAYLRRHRKGVAKNSLHITGQAADVRLANRRLKELRDAAYVLKGGGVGYYPESNFVHIDVGRIRFW